MYHLFVNIYIIYIIFIYSIAGIVITYVNLSDNEFFVCDTVIYDTSMYIFYCFLIGWINKRLMNS